MMLAGVALLGSVGCGGSGPTKPSATAADKDHGWMVIELNRLADSASPDENAFLNDRRAQLARQRLAAATGYDQKMLGRIGLGVELLLSGRSEQALTELRAAEQLMQPLRSRFDRQSLITFQECITAACFRIAEQQNCLERHTIDSCLMPIGASGVHTIERGSRMAIVECEKLLRAEPERLAYRWLINLAYMTLGEYPDRVPSQWRIPPETFESDYDIPRFRDVAPRLGLDVMALSGGSIMEDFDRDGLLDIMCSSWGLTDQLRFFKNNGDGTFSDRTELAGLTGLIGGLNLVHGDYNNDGFPDVLVLRGAWLRKAGEHPNSLLRNNGDGTFSDVTKQAGLLCYHPTQTAAWADYNNDGQLDLFIGAESTTTQRHPCQLFRNNGDGTFTDVAAQVGVAHVAYVKGVAWGDFNNDGRVDLFLSCFSSDNVLFRNSGPLRGSGDRQIWHFTDVSEKAGITAPTFSFPTWFWDYDNDGWLDLFVGSFASFEEGSLEAVVADYLNRPTDQDRCHLYRNRGDGTFADVSAEVNLDAVMLAMGANFGDIDNDGYLDCYIGTGQPDLLSLVPNRMYRNDAGRKFQNVTTAGGFGHIQKGHGIAFGDIDNDGDQDIYAVMGGAYSGDVYGNVLFENPGHGNHWITLQLEGVESNRAAIGTRIRLELQTDDGRRDIYATVGTGGSFGGSSLQQELGLGRAIAIRRLQITWPATGTVQTFKDVPMDRCLAIREGDGQLKDLKRKRFALSPSDGGTGGGNRTTIARSTGGR